MSMTIRRRLQLLSSCLYDARNDQVGISAVMIPPPPLPFRESVQQHLLHCMWIISVPKTYLQHWHGIVCGCCERIKFGCFQLSIVPMVHNTTWPWRALICNSFAGPRRGHSGRPQRACSKGKRAGDSAHGFSVRRLPAAFEGRSGGGRQICRHLV